MRSLRPGKKRIAAGILGFLMLFAVLFSVFYVSLEADHECCGEDCQICVTIRQCEDILRQTGSGVTVRAAVALVFILLLIKSFSIASNVPVETLVTDKVRMNN